ncbi:MAG: cell envelope integrity protein TolA [Gammaproteobacteria bacterium]|nr:cell envelope integrity protein TolA [Gammaproteobacteria bacterium]MBP9728860.1 cell envelope integrity protein TolA [Gammaproteobacteria bacterium]
MRDSSPYSKSFVGSLLIHLILLSFLILSFNQRVHLSTPASSDSIIQAVVVDAHEPDTREADRLHQVQQVLQREQKQQQAQEAQKKQQLQRDMLEAKKEVAPQQPPKKVESLAPEKQDLAVIAVEEERFAENERLKQVRLTQAKEQKKRDQQLKEQKALKALVALKAKEAALKTKLAADKAKIASEKSRIAAEKASLAAHQKQINTAVTSVVSAWSAKIEGNRRSMSAFQSLPQDLSCKISLHVLPDGSVRAQLVQSSGNALYDDLALKAIYKAEPFALPDDPEVREQVKAIEFNFLNDT